MPTRAKRPKDKVNVEAAVKIATQRVIYVLDGHQCVGLDELNSQITALGYRTIRLLAYVGSMSPTPTSSWRTWTTPRDPRGSTVVTTQFTPDEWYKSIPDAVIAESILNRLVAGAEIITFEGPNLRLNQ